VGCFFKKNVRYNSKINMKKNKIYGYARVSTPDQRLENQKIQINKYAAQNDLVIDEFVEEKISGTVPLSKRLLGDLLNKVKKGDVIIFTEMSRFGRSSGELVHQLQLFIREGIHFIFLKENLNTKSTHSRLITNLMITIFGGIYQFERDLISERTKEGLIRAKKEGKHIGRPKGSKSSRLKLDLYYDKIKEYKKLGLNHTAISKLLSVHPMTLTSFMKRRGLLKIKK